ncbi:MAG: isochorismatase family protein [Rhizobiales bacterium]|nr:isochorismatase family protein [Hyphomicrobiales bacterium]
MTTDTPSRPWSGIITADEERRYEAAGFGRPGGSGRRAALLIIDVQYRTTGTQRQPYWQAIADYPTACGEAAWDAVDHIAPLLQRFRQLGLPVLYPHVAPKNAETDAGRLAAKVPAMMTIDARGYTFVDAIAPASGDILLPKKHPSAFFGTPLVSHLIDLGVDTLFVTGCSTSGCVRSSVVDAFSLNFRVVVPEECVYDRSPTSHAVNLWDMNAKYADVMPVAEAMALLDPPSQERPAGEAR